MGVFHVFQISQIVPIQAKHLKCSLVSLEPSPDKTHIQNHCFNIFETSYSFSEFETCVGISLSTALKLTKTKILVYVASQTY